MSYKLIYAILGSIILSIIVLINLKSAGADPCLANIFSSIGIGFVAGFIIGLIKDRGEDVKNRLVHMVDDRTEELGRKAKELETSKKQTAVLRDLLPLCPTCRSIRNCNGDWQHIETYLQHYSTGDSGSHHCPDCSLNQTIAGPQYGRQPIAS
jgi:hypothetical protein